MKCVISNHDKLLYGHTPRSGHKSRKSSDFRWENCASQRISKPLPTTLFKGSFKQTFIEDINLKKKPKKHLNYPQSFKAHSKLLFEVFNT